MVSRDSHLLARARAAQKLPLEQAEDPLFLEMQDERGRAALLAPRSATGLTDAARLGLNRAPYAHRLENLRELVNLCDDDEALARLVRMSEDRLSSATHQHGSVRLTQKESAAVEVALGMPTGSMDTPGAVSQHASALAIVFAFHRPVAQELAPTPIDNLPVESVGRRECGEATGESQSDIPTPSQAAQCVDENNTGLSARPQAGATDRPFADFGGPPSTPAETQSRQVDSAFINSLAEACGGPVRLAKATGIDPKFLNDVCQGTWCGDSARVRRAIETELCLSFSFVDGPPAMEVAMRGAASRVKQLLLQQKRARRTTGPR